MALVQTILMEKDGAKMRVNKEEVVNYEAQGWKVAKEKKAEQLKFEKTKPGVLGDMTLDEATVSEDTVKMYKDGSVTMAALTEVDALKANGWDVATG